MSPNGMFADTQCTGDLTVGTAIGYMQQHFRLARGQPKRLQGRCGSNGLRFREQQHATKFRRAYQADLQSIGAELFGEHCGRRSRAGICGGPFAQPRDNFFRQGQGTPGLARAGGPLSW